MCVIELVNCSLDSRVYYAQTNGRQVPSVDVAAERTRESSSLVPQDISSRGDGDPNSA